MSSGEGIYETRKRLRKGTKSCTECRRRKLRCIFTSATDRVCQQCAAKALTCVPQVYRIKQSGEEASSKDRINKLEKQVANLVATVHASPNDDIHDNDELSDASAAQDSAAVIPPTHLRLLFDNIAVVDQSAQALKNTTDRLALTKLQRLIPARDDVAAIADSASTWMLLYYVFFPASSVVGLPHNLSASYDTSTAPDADIIEVAALLLSLAITLLQLKVSRVDLRLLSISDPATFVRRVVKTVQVNVISNNDLAATYTGIELHVLYIRVLLAMGSVRDMFLTIRRTVALAEFLGLQKIPYNTAALSTDDRKMGLLKVICATDRMASMMFNHPPATARFNLSPERIIDDTGLVSVHAYMMEVSQLAAAVQEVDEELALGRPYHEVYEKIISSDTKLRALAGRTPPNWWDLETTHFDPKQLAQSFHRYLTVRVHLHSAMRRDPHGQYAYSRTACIEACYEATRRILCLRQTLPKGFFLFSLLQMQIFTVAIVLMLSHREDMRDFYSTEAQRDDLVLSVIRAMEEDTQQQQGNVVFASEAAIALRALQRWLRSPGFSEGLALRVPMLGKVVMGRRQSATEIAHAVQSHQSQQSQSYAEANTLDWDQPWMLELDMNAAYDDAFLTAGLGDLEQYWPSQGGLSFETPT